MGFYFSIEIVGVTAAIIDADFLRLYLLAFEGSYFLRDSGLFLLHEDGY